MNAVDTNILIYTHDPRDSVKQNIAVNLVASLTEGALLWQVACEYIAASRKLTNYGLNAERAFATLQELRRIWKPSLPTWMVLDKAENLIATVHLSIWDALIIAGCIEGGVTRLYSEDMDSSLTAKTGVAVVNPFN